MNDRLEEARYRFQDLENNVGSDRERIKRELDDANSKLKAVKLELKEAVRDIIELQAGENKTTKEPKKTKDEKGLLFRETLNYQLKLNNIRSNSTSAQMNIDKLELRLRELEFEKTSLQNRVTEYESLKEDANQHKMNLTSELKSKNDIIRSLKDENMDSSKENLELLLDELKDKNTSL